MPLGSENTRTMVRVSTPLIKHESEQPETQHHSVVTRAPLQLIGQTFSAVSCLVPGRMDGKSIQLIESATRPGNFVKVRLYLIYMRLNYFIYTDGRTGFQRGRSFANLTEGTIINVLNLQNYGDLLLACRSFKSVQL